MKKNKGNWSAQRKRREERKKRLPEKQIEEVRLIDGNYSHYPVAYCSYYQGFLTIGLEETHRCICRECEKYNPIIAADKVGDSD